MSQVPAVRNDAVFPESAHTVGVADAKATVKPELDVALRVSCDSAYCVVVTGVKVMLW